VWVIAVGEEKIWEDVPDRRWVLCKGGVELLDMQKFATGRIATGEAPLMVFETKGEACRMCREMNRMYYGFKHCPMKMTEEMEVFQMEMEMRG